MKSMCLSERSFTSSSQGGSSVQRIQERAKRTRSVSGIHVLDELMKAKRQMATKRQIAYVYRSNVEKKLDAKELAIRSAFEKEETQLSAQL